MNHAIIVEESLRDLDLLKQFTILKSEKGKEFTLHLIEVIDLDNFIDKIQKAMKPNKPYYCHVYNNGISLTIIYKDAIFRVNPNNKNTWINAVRHGKNHKIPPNQLDFYPTRIAEEKEWFK